MSYLRLLVLRIPNTAPGRLFPRPALLEHKVKSRLDFFGVVVLHAVVGLRDECLAQAQARKAQISLADLCGEETISCRALTQCSRMAARLQAYLCTGLLEQAPTPCGASCGL